MYRTKPPYRVDIGQPSPGSIMDPAAEASFLASKQHECTRIPSTGSGGNFNSLLTSALNKGELGQLDFFGMVHADIGVVSPKSMAEKRWADVLIEEMTRIGAVFISVPMAIKDERGVTSSGVGWANKWNPWRRLTVAELRKLPPTFTKVEYGYPDREYFLLHNHALCMWDMRWPGWYKTASDGVTAPAFFNFVETIRRIGPAETPWMKDQESDDWWFSRRLWEMGAKTAITSKVKTVHFGQVPWPNWDKGHYLWQDGDETTAPQWRPKTKRRVTCKKSSSKKSPRQKRTSRTVSASCK